jgi:outer membrane protein assembly factor BamB
MYKLLLVLTILSSSLFADDWSNWRGPTFNGAADAKNLPIKFSPNKNVKWQVNLKGTGASTPVISNNYTFLTAANLEKEELLGICIDTKTGKTLWNKSIGSGYKPKGTQSKAQLDSRSNYASPSAVTDGKHVAFFFGNGDLVCFDTAGTEKWRHNLQKEEGDFSFQWTFSSTPTLFKGKIYLPVLQRNEIVHGRGKVGNESYIICYDFTTGKKLWKHIRPSNAKKESLESFATILPTKINGKDHLVLAGGDVLTGHDPQTGKELWRWGTWNKNHREQWWRLVPSHCPGPDNTFVICAPKKAPVYAIQVAADNSTKLLWKSEAKSKVTSDVPTPLFFDNHFYILSDLKRSLSKVNPKDGTVVWTVPTPGMSKYRSSPLGADGKIYLMNHGAEVIVIDAKNGKILAENSMAPDQDAYARASIVCVNNQLFIRTETALYCIGN